MMENEILDLLAAELNLPDIAPDEITVKMLVERSGRSESAVSDLLKAKVSSGDMLTRRVRGPSGHPVMAYRKAQAIQEVE